MSLKLMYITNRCDVAKAAQECGVDRVFVDLETLGKEDRQRGLNTVKSHHTLQDAREIRKVLTTSDLLVRINQWNDNSENEIKDVLDCGADIIMLPYFKTAETADKFIKAVNGKARCCLLLETKEAVDNIDEILSLDGIDEIHIGLNDLHISYHLDFMFELLANGTVEMLTKKIAARNIPYGFGGIARLGFGAIPAELIIAEHYRLGSSMAILSRHFCNIISTPDIKDIINIFAAGLRNIREYEKRMLTESEDFFEENRIKVINAVNSIIQKS